MPFIDSSLASWDRILPSLVFDFYQLPAYCELEAEVLQGKPMAWYGSIDGFNFIIPLIERVIHKNGVIERDLVSPYGYPGIAFSKGATNESVLRALYMFDEQAAHAGYVSSFIRLHPIYNAFEVSCDDRISQHGHGQTVSIDLTLPINTTREAYSKDHKRNLKRLSREKFSVEVNNWDSLQEFIDLYTSTMARKHAQSRYFFSRDYFNKLKEILNENLVLISVVDSLGVMASGGIFTICNNLAQFHLSGTAESFIKYSPSRRMLDAAIVTCKSLGAHTLHLGGGYGSSNSDGLFQFKSGFGHQLHNFSTLRFIHQPDKYQQLIQLNANTKNAGAYFPEYRFLKS